MSNKGLLGNDLVRATKPGYKTDNLESNKIELGKTQNTNNRRPLGLDRRFFDLPLAIGPISNFSRL